MVFITYNSATGLIQDPFFRTQALADAHAAATSGVVSLIGGVSNAPGWAIPGRVYWRNGFQIDPALSALDTLKVAARTAHQALVSRDQGIQEISVAHLTAHVARSRDILTQMHGGAYNIAHDTSKTNTFRRQCLAAQAVGANDAYTVDGLLEKVHSTFSTAVLGPNAIEAFSRTTGAQVSFDTMIATSVSGTAMPSPSQLSDGGWIEDLTG